MDFRTNYERWLENNTIFDEWYNTLPSDKQADFDNSLLLDCQRLRKVEYDLLNQYDLMYYDKVNGTNTWGEAIEAIKSKYPKPEKVTNGN